MSWTIIDSPVGELRLVENDGATHPDRVPPVPRATTAVRAAAATTTSRSSSRPRASSVRTSTATSRSSTSRWRRSAPSSSSGSGQGLREIGYGETSSYGELAHRLGKSNAASRAVGLANGRNPIPIVIPCHRVIGANGTLTGYAGGLDRKQKLLELEQDALF